MSRSSEEHLEPIFARLEGEELDGLLEALHKKPGSFPQRLLRILFRTYRRVAEASRQELREAWAERGKRAFADDDLPVTRWAIPDIYRNYLMQLVGIFQVDLLRRAREVLAEGEEQGLSTNDLATALGEVLTTLAYPRLITIVRTEGTRVASAARRDIALEAAQRGRGPQWLIYSAILDDRVTHTCHYAHGHRRPLEDEEDLWSIIPPPNHYNCRSIERYGFPWREKDIEAPEWGPDAVATFLEIQREEFPRWENRPLPPAFRAQK